MTWRRRLFVSVSALVALVLGTTSVPAQLRPISKAPSSTVASNVSSPHGTSLTEPCASCHQANAWKPARISPSFRHAEKTFPLSGAHVSTTCLSCHKTLEFKGTASTCASCHTDPHQGEMGTTCARCHNTRSFVDRGTAVRTHQATRFPLRGAHAIATCESCHAKVGPGQPQFSARSTTCESCHLPTFRATKSPSHEAAHFSRDCTSCHTIAAWTGAQFDHAATKFPLTGRHQVATCAGCHADNVFAGKSTTCVSCHRTDYNAVKEPRHDQGFPTTCESCHVTAGWKGAKFDHQTQTRFALTGRHVSASCSSCHTGGTYVGTPSTCVGCHQGNFDRTTAPPHKAAGFATTCTTCHTTTTWTGAPFDHATTRFALTGAHRTPTCAACHGDGVYRGKPMTCVSCHQTKYDATTKPHHGPANFATTCESCHSTQDWNGASFDHAKTRFPLLGKHVSATCLACHSDRVYAGKPSVCVSCHQREYDATARPNHRVAGIVGACESCHTSVGWTPATFDHATTRFALVGAHGAVSCAGCHADNVYRGKSMACVSCHQANFDATTTPNHKTSGFPTACQNCHTPTLWTSGLFDHSTSAFPLTGGHRSVTCASCHGDNVFKGKPTACASCHQAKFDATTSPHHAQANFANTCQSCHSTTDWLSATFDHSKTRFPLLGKHVPATCLACHSDRVYAGKPSVCVSCHQRDFDASLNPNHKLAGYPTTCESCHSSTGWKPSTFDHATTRFPLQGNHRTATCTSCHGDGVYRGKVMTCVGCHQAKFDATTKPNHRTSSFPTTCETCHATTATAWTPAAFDHNATRFPLTGNHRTATCASCHSDGVYRGKVMTCVGCHQAKFDATTAPNHRVAGYPTTCETCHSTAATAWTPATFDHAATRFPLTGGHRTVTCQGCHSDNVYRGKIMTCVGCHQAKFDATTNPHHAPAKFATACESCHTTATWGGAVFDHTKTQFALRGVHLSQTCLACHSDRVYAGKPSVCVSCHLAKYNATTNPNHVTSSFPTTCETCHSTTATAWTPASFDHATTRFPLQGAHRTATCTSCHGDGVYRGKTMTCVGCHQAKYNATTKPNHATSSFPTTCETCHATTAVAWTPASFDHATTRFPLQGAHRTATCTSCHGDGVYRGKVMTCVGCHQAKYDATSTPNHRLVGYPTTCETCHSTTAAAWTPAAFDHANTRFPLTGGHRTVTCQGCHSDNVYRGKIMTCVGCHQAKFDATTNPHHGPARFATACESCHTTATWGGAVFDHTKTTFALRGVHLSQTCLACHNDRVYAGKPSVCVSCHLAKYNATTNPNHVTSSFPTTCETCHSTAATAWTPASFDHATTRFPLQGAHRTATCTSCHGDGVYRGKVMTCVGCHQAKYNATTNPNHVTSSFPTTCETCHATTAIAWTPASFDHNTTRFPLVGGHRTATCASCHGDGVYRGKVMTCVGCHLAKFNATTAPNHTTAAFATTCESCHTPVTWVPSTFDHNTSRFPLTGAHRTQTCAACHADGIYRGKTMVCSGCHLVQYNATTNPNHRTAQFPQTCESCHTTTMWTGATFNHDPWFPIYSGKHKQKWTTCTQCHANTANYADFTCLSCHEHAKTTMDSKHQGRNGYSYASPACYSCHPRGTH